MKTRLLAITIAIVGLLSFSPTFNVANASPVEPVKKFDAVNKVNAVSIPITGTIPSIDGTFEGTFDLIRFTSQGGVLYAVGTLTGTLEDALGNVIGTVTNIPIRLPVTGASGSCQILHLELGPLDLDLLGLQVHLDQVVLDITAQSGSGNLLGNLLCAVAGLLDQGSSAALVRLLNQIVGLIG